MHTYKFPFSIIFHLCCCTLTNRLFPNSLQSLFESKSKCNIFVMVISSNIISIWMKTDIHIKDFACGLTLKERLMAIWEMVYCSPSRGCKGFWLQYANYSTLQISLPQMRKGKSHCVHFWKISWGDNLKNVSLTFFEHYRRVSVQKTGDIGFKKLWDILDIYPCYLWSIKLSAIAWHCFIKSCYSIWSVDTFT